MAHDIFISYSTQDKVTADAVCAALERRNFRCWVAPRDVFPGMLWPEAIMKGLTDSRVMVLVFSEHSNKSTQVYNEVERAVHRGLPIIPFRIDDVPMAPSLELFLGGRHWLDALSPPIERHIAYLTDTIARLLPDRVSQPPAREDGRPPGPAEVAAANGRAGADGAQPAGDGVLRLRDAEAVDQATPAKCAACGAELDIGALFCGECGAAAGQPRSRLACRRCGALNSAQAAFCGDCGVRVPT